LIPEANRRAIACAEAIRSVTHLVLARAPGILFSKSFPDFCFSIRAAPNPDSSGSRKRSVPVRVHSVRKNSGFTGPGCLAPASNPLLTHGTVESPAKLSLAASLFA
jgi:hypothetical protein